MCLVNDIDIATLYTVVLVYIEYFNLIVQNECLSGTKRFKEFFSLLSFLPSLSPTPFQLAT
jgi:hypothetical protein